MKGKKKEFGLELGFELNWRPCTSQKEIWAKFGTLAKPNDF